MTEFRLQIFNFNNSKRAKFVFKMWGYIVSYELICNHS